MATVSQQYIFNKIYQQGASAQEAESFAAIAQAESSLNPSNVGDGGNSIGLFQIYIPAHRDKLIKATGSTSEAVWKSWLKNPDNNINMAVQVYQAAGFKFTPWTVYNTGAYRQYLGKDLPTIGQGDASTWTEDENDEGGGGLFGSNSFDWNAPLQTFFKYVVIIGLAIVGIISLFQTFPIVEDGVNAAKKVVTKGRS